ncbi:putative methylenetetrahydrofolate dehydrogenase [Planoprotostelium fungivorum]|uniref:Putative methylenetetrahydrofolate dehydrogenase n=1 Tax=Planoprotostelium fungivorum TaxID=1890364 RepID=A0A2P6NK74_9EUKA|nr:putative methylenetetrahydrofolate dehydrogenase [Planoprotostelium fungivorum]
MRDQNNSGITLRVRARPRGRSCKPMISRITRITPRPLNVSFNPISHRHISNQLIKKMAESKRIDGKAIATTIQQEIKEKTTKLIEEKGLKPGLAVVLVGNRQDSLTYIRMKQKAAEEVGFNFILQKAPETITQKELVSLVHELNENNQVHGLIVQLPLPSHIDEKQILDEVSISKDIDGFHPANIGALAMRGREPTFVSCTPKGCLEILDRLKIDLEGKKVVVLGRSNIVGVPVSLLCLKRNATVTVCHSRTADLPAQCRQADVLIAAVGQPELVKGDWLKEGAVVIDVGINSIDDQTKKAGYRLVGDVDYASAVEKASMITPVPGGVGPMTVAMLLQNTLTSALRWSESK